MPHPFQVLLAKRLKEAIKKNNISPDVERKRYLSIMEKFIPESELPLLLKEPTDGLLELVCSVFVEIMNKNPDSDIVPQIVILLTNSNSKFEEEIETILKPLN